MSKEYFTKKEWVAYTRENCLKDDVKTDNNSNPSEALECLEKIGNLWLFGDNCVKVFYEEEFNTIKQALTTKSDKELAFDIIVKKSVDVLELRIFIEYHKDSVALNLYNQKIGNDWQLTQEEFELLKKVVAYV